MTQIEILGIALLVFFIIMSLILRSEKNEYKRLFNKLQEEIKQDEEDRNSGRTVIPVTFGGVCKYIYADSTPKEFAKQFGAPWKTETSVNALGHKSVSLTYTYTHTLSGTDFMHAWFNENYRLESIHTN